MKDLFCDQAKTSWDEYKKSCHCHKNLQIYKIPQNAVIIKNSFFVTVITGYSILKKGQIFSIVWVFHLQECKKMQTLRENMSGSHLNHAVDG